MTPPRIPISPLARSSASPSTASPPPEIHGGKTGTPTVPVIDPPKDTEAAKTAPSSEPTPSRPISPVRDLEHGSPHPLRPRLRTRRPLWSSSTAQGRRRAQPHRAGKNYGWPLASYATNYNGVPIPSPDTRSDLTKPVIYWTPVIAPATSCSIAAPCSPSGKVRLHQRPRTMSLNRITFDGNGGPTRRTLAVGHRIRDVEQAPTAPLADRGRPRRRPLPRHTEVTSLTPQLRIIKNPAATSSLP